MYITYKYPSQFKEVEPDNEYDKKNVYEFYSDDKLSFVLKVEEYSLGLSFAKIEEDAKALETDSQHKDVSYKTIKVTGKNLVRYSFKINH